MPLFSASTSCWRRTSAWRSASPRSARATCTSVGNLKIDAPPPPVDVGELERLKAALGGRPVFVAASTHEGEEEIVAAAHRALRAQLREPVHDHRAAPSRARHGARRDARRTSASRSRSARSAQLPGPRTDIYIADTIGELGTLYALAPVAFIGGSLVDRGGQNPIEAIRHGAAVLTGPHWQNFRDAYRTLLRHKGAIEVEVGGRCRRRRRQAARRPGRAAAHARGRQAGAGDAVRRARQDGRGAAALPSRREIEACVLTSRPGGTAARTTSASARSSPLGRLYGWIAERRYRRSHPYRSRLPVICVGNFTAGGTGKTPLALFIARQLIAARRAAGVPDARLRRAHARARPGSTSAPTPRGCTATSRCCSRAWRRRSSRATARAGIIAIETRGRDASVIVMDDGLQNPSLAKDLSIALVDGRRGIGNGEVIPAGPLRAPLEFQLGLVDAIVVRDPPNAADERGVHAVLRQGFPGPVLAAQVAARRRHGVARTARRSSPSPASAIRSASIGLLERLGGKLIERVSFPDHHALCARRRRAARRAGAGAAARSSSPRRRTWRGCGGDAALAELAAQTRTLPIELKFDERDLGRLQLADRGGAQGHVAAAPAAAAALELFGSRAACRASAGSAAARPPATHRPPAARRSNSAGRAA